MAEPNYIGPLFSHFGIRTWDLWLQPDAVLAVRNGFFRTFRLGAGEYFGFPRDPESPVVIEGLPGRVFALAEIGTIIVKRCYASHNEVRLLLRDSTTVVFGICNRRRTGEIRTKLSSYYSEIYQEVGFRIDIARREI